MPLKDGIRSDLLTRHHTCQTTPQTLVLNLLISPPLLLLLISHDRNATAAIAVAVKAAKATSIPTTVEDDSTALTTEISLTQDQVSEINRIQANLLNFGTSVSEMTAYLGGLHIKE